MTDQTADRWLLFLMQLPTRPAAPRIKVWRRLQQIGSVSLRGSVYVLPHTPQAREDFEWLREEVLAAGGQASLLAARALTPDEDRAIVEAFQAARSADFKALAASVRRLKPARGVERAFRAAQHELARIEAIDFAGSPERDKAVAAIGALAARLAGPERKDAMPDVVDRVLAKSYKGRTWVTRTRPGVDRMSSAWLIRRFIDPKARFDFRSAPPPASSKDVPFDMFGVEFGHAGDRCTFETLAGRFGIDDHAVQRIGEIVHDVDLKEDRFGHPETAMVNDLVEGLRRAHPDDHVLLEHGMAMFGGLYESFKAAPAATGGKTRKKR